MDDLEKYKREKKLELTRKARVFFAKLDAKVEIDKINNKK